MKTIKAAIGIILLSLTAISCSKDSPSKILFEKDFSSDHPDWTVSGDTIVQQFNLPLKDSKEPLKIFWLASKDTAGCLQVSYARLERVNSDSDLKADSLTAESGMCGTDWESPDSTRYNQLLFMGTFTKSKTIGKNVKQGNFLIITGNGKLTVN